MTGLGLALGFADGVAMVSMRNRTVAGGVEVVALDLELADISFPVDVKGGAEEFQRRATRLRNLEVRFDLGAMSDRLAAYLMKIGSPIERPSLVADGGGIALEGELAAAGRRAPFSASLVVGPSEPRGLRIFVVDAFAFDWVSATTAVIPDAIHDAIGHALSPIGERVAESLRRAGPTSIALDPVGALLWALLPPNGWKLPAHDHVQVRSIHVLGDALIFAAGEPVTSAPAPAPPALDDAVLFAMAREEAGQIAPDVSRLVAEDDLPSAFRELSNTLDASGGPDVVLERALAIGLADPDLARDVGNLSDDELARNDRSVPALLAKGALASRDDLDEQAVLFYEQAARALRARGRRRLAGLAFLAASRFRADLREERVRLLEEAIAVRPDDVSALEGLIEELPKVGRANAAVRAARKLATIHRSAADRARAHAIAGALLRDPLKDPAQAKREFEKALKLAPDDSLALEGLALSIMDQGDPRKAASLLESLIDKAERGGDRGRAAQLCLVLGRFWLAKDHEAAMSRFRKAHELDRGAVAPLLELGRAALEKGKVAAAVEAVEDALRALTERRPSGPDPALVLDLLVLAGEVYEVAGRRLDAIAQLEGARALAGAAVAPDVLSALARLYEAEGREDARARVLFERGRIAAGAGDLDEAAELWSQEALLSAGDRPALEQLEKEIARALERDRSHRRLLDLQVTIADLIGAPLALVAALDQRLLLEDSPAERASLLARMGEALEKAGRSVEASRAYEEAIGQDPREARSVAALVRIYRNREDRARLAEILDRAAVLSADPRARASLFAERARILSDLGRAEQAFDAATAAVDGDPENLLHLALATTLALRFGKHERALEIAHRRLALVQATASSRETQLELYMDLAKIAEAIGDQTELAAALELAHGLADRDSETGRQIAARLASALFAAGRHGDLAALLRARGRVATAPAGERAERFVEAARITSELGDHDQACRDVDEALRILAFEGGDPSIGRAGFDVLEAIARKKNDPSELAQVFGRRAAAANEVDLKERLRLEQASILESAGLLVEAVEALEEAADELPGSLGIARRLGAVAEKAEEGPVAAYALGRAARLATDADRKDLAIELHAGAARIYADIGEDAHALIHDRALLSLVPPGDPVEWMRQSIDRLEAFARHERDAVLLVELLSRKALSLPPIASARLLLEKASIEASVLSDERAALDSLRRARSLAPEGSDIAASIDEDLIGRLESHGHHRELAQVLVECAERASDAGRQSLFLTRAAIICDERLGERHLALSRAQAAVRADHTNTVARQLRLRLSREVGRREALVDALTEEAALARGGDEARALWVEAAELLAPRASIEAGELVPSADIERALNLVRRAATAAPKAAAPLFSAAAYTRALGRPGEEFVALGQLVEREISRGEKAAAQLRRVELMSTDLDDSMGAQAELSSAIELLEGLHPEAPLLEHLPPSTRERLTSGATPLHSALEWGLVLTELNKDFQTHVRMIMRLVDKADQPELRARLRTRAGEILEWKVGDGEAAEREYLAALAALPEYGPAKKALRTFYVAFGRFGSLAENVGVSALRDVWAEVKSEGQHARMVDCAEALWPLLEEGSSERAEIQLELADLYVVDRGREADVVFALENVVRTGPRAQQDAALERLRVLFLENERFDLYCDVLRRQAERIENDAQRALAIVELAEALEWKLGDWQAAETEYQAALALDRSCQVGRQKLCDLLASQDRFQDIAANLGRDMIEGVVERLVEHPDREKDRAIKAALALEPLLAAEERPVLWMDLAERFRTAGAPTLEAQRVALSKVASFGGPATARALDLLRPVLVELGDAAALAELLRKRIAAEPDRDARLELELELARRSPDETGAEAERCLLSVLEARPHHEEARALLERLYVDRRRLTDLGRALGLPALAQIRERAERSNDRLLAKEALSALAELTEAPERRASLLVELVAFDEARAEEVYRRALAASPTHQEAVEGLRALFERSGRYREIAAVLGVDALRRSVAGLRGANDPIGLLPAALSLAHVLDGDANAAERAELLLEVGRLQLAENDPEAGEVSFRRALEANPEHAAAREEVRTLLVAQGRFGDLADIDERLVSETASIAARNGDVGLEVDAMSALADRREGQAKADTLVLISALERRRGREREAELHLRAALRSAPDHALAMGEIEGLLWNQERFGDLVAVLGPGAIVHRAHVEFSTAPEKVLRALESVRERLPDELGAEGFELTAQIARSGVDPAGDRRRRMDHLEAARGLWDDLGRHEGQERVRLAIVDLLREEERSDPAAADRARIEQSLIDALEDALRHSRDSNVRGQLTVERAVRLHAVDRREEAVALLAPMIDDDGMRFEHRAEAARVMIEDLSAGRSLDTLELAEIELEERALAILAQAMPRQAWLLRLGDAREALGADGDLVAEALERALEIEMPEGEQLAIRRRLRELYEQNGDWAGAERHASFIADADDRPEAWVGLSELRVWLDDRNGAERALESALEKNRSASEIHGALVRLAEQAGETEKVAHRLEAWAEADTIGDRRGRAERLLRASWLVMTDDAERAALLAERAVDLIPPRSDAVEPIANEALELLSVLGKKAAMIAILTRLVGEVLGPRTSEIRLRLADLLAAEGREDEARTVIEQGIHRDTPADDPLVERLVANARADASDRTARRLLFAADRLGAGAAARRLRLVGAEISESAGDDQSARSAWSTLVSHAGAVGDDGARARASLVRLNRRIGDHAALLDALLDTTEDAPPGEARARLLVEAAELARNELHDLERAEALLKRAMAEAPNDRRTGDLLAGVLEGHGRWIELDAALAERAAGLSGQALAETLIRRAEIARAQIRDDHRAAELLVAAHRAWPSLARAREAAEALVRTGALLEAARLVDEALGTGLDGDRETILGLELLRATAYDAGGQADEACDALADLARRMPDSALVRARRFELLSRYGRWRALAAALEESAGHSSATPAGGFASIRLRLAAARLYLERVGDRAEAERALENAVRTVERWLASPDAAIPEQLGWGAGDELEDESESPLLDLAAMAVELENHALRVDALRLYAQSLPAGPSQWRALLSLASAEREAGDLDAAEFTLRGVVEAVRGSDDVSPRDRVEAERSLGALLLDRDNPKDAAEALARAATLLDDSSGWSARSKRAQILVQLSDAHRAMGQPRDALLALTEARTLAPDEIPQSQYEQAVEAAGPSEALALLLERKAEMVAEGSGERAAILREAARIWETIGRRSRSFVPLLLAYVEDPANVEEAQRLQELLYRAERWPDLERHLARRLEVEDLGRAERARMLAERARVLATHLGRNEIALELLDQALALVPASVELMSEVARQAALLGDSKLEGEALARIATAARSSPAKRRALAERAVLLERAHDREGAAQCLEQVLASTEGPTRRAVADRTVALHLANGHPDAAARVLIDCALAVEGPERAAYLARAAAIRLDRLGDTRGAIAAFEAAVRSSPADIGLTRSVMELAKRIGDREKARGRAAALAELAHEAGKRDARVLYLLEVARSSAVLGDVDAELAAYDAALGARPSASATLDEIVARARAALPAERVVAILEARIEALEAGAIRARHRLALARILEEPLGRHWEAQGLREQAAKSDLGEAAPPDARDAASQGVLEDENFRALRALLDRSGRWNELTDLEERRAKGLSDPVARAEALAEVGRIHFEHLPADWQERPAEEAVAERLNRARDALTRALEADPNNIAALSVMARIELASRNWARAAPVFSRLERLGGPAWPPAELEVAAAIVARANDDPNLAVARALEAKRRDPGSLDALRILADLCDRVQDAPDREVWIDELCSRLDPLLDAREMAELLVRRAEIANAKGQADLARRRLERALAISPEDVRALELHRELMEASGASRALVDFLEREALRPDAPDPRGNLLSALSVAIADGEERRSVRIAERLERYLDNREVAGRLIRFYRDIGAGDGLLRVADALDGVDALGPLEPDAKTRLAAALLHAARYEDAFRLLATFIPEGDLAELERSDLSEFDRRTSEAVLRAGERWDRAAHDASSIRSPRILHRFRSVLLGLDEPAALSSVALRMLEGLYAASGGHEIFARPLAEAYRARRIAPESAARILRRLLATNPTQLELVRALHEVLGGEAANGEAAGARSVLALLSGAEERSGGFPPLSSGASVVDRLHGALTTPIAKLLRLTAMAVAPELPREEGKWVRASSDRRLADAIAAVSEVSPIGLDVWLDPDGGEVVAIVPGDPPRIVVGEALADDASASELRFHVGRAAMLVDLGYLLVERTSGAARQRLLTILVSMTGTGRPSPAEAEAARDRIRARLEPSVLRDVRALDVLIPSGATGLEVDLEEWMRGSLAAADRFGLLVSGELPAALRGLRRNEPRTLGEPFTTSEDRIASVKRWRSASDLVAFVLSHDFSELTRTFRTAERRFR
jgi:tetratricopeptide (TPR) repeat protein